MRSADSTHIHQLAAQGVDIAAIALRLGITRATVRNKLNGYRKKEAPLEKQGQVCVSEDLRQDAEISPQPHDKPSLKEIQINL